MAAPKRAHSASVHLIYLALIVAGPLLLLVGALLWRSVALERGQLERRVLQVLEALVADLDRDVDRRLTILQTLATSPSLAAEDWPAFHAQAREGLQGKGYLVLVDAAGRQLVNTYLPYGAAPALTGDPETLRRVRETGRPVVSDLFISLATRQPVYNVSIPVRRDGTLRYVVSIGLTPADLHAILEGQSLDPRWTLTIWDGNGRILSRSRDQGRLLGTAVPGDLRASPLGRITRLALDGEDNFVAVGQGEWSNWRAAVAFPASLIDSQVQESLLLWGLTIVLVAGLVVVFAWLFGRALTSPLRAATAAAGALGRGEPFELRESRIVEVNAVIAALLRAQREVEQSSAALRRSEEQLRTAAEAAEFGAHHYDVAADRTERSPQFLKILGATSGDQTATFDAGMGYVHPDDREATRRRKQEILAGGDGGRYQLEYRIRRTDGVVRWVLDRGQVMRDPSSGRALQVVGVVLDITDLKAAEQRHRLLLDELNHRVKNTLAIVQALAQQTLRNTADPDAFAAAFEARLGSLARAHDLLTRDSWRGVPLGEVVSAALAPFVAADHRVSIAGPAVTIPPTATVTLSLMLHELATNAAKYGALAESMGALDISWTIADNGATVEIHLCWLERDGPAVVPPTRQGFGSRLLATGARQLGGQVELTYEATGLRCALRFIVPTSSG